MFASSSVRVHVVRGIFGIGLLVAAFALVPRLGGAALLLAVPAVVLLRGCPTCWALGLAQTRAAARQRQLKSSTSRPRTPPASSVRCACSARSAGSTWATRRV